MVTLVSRKEFMNRAKVQIEGHFENHVIKSRSGEPGLRRFTLRHPETSNFWVEIVELTSGLYVGGDIDHVVFQRHSGSAHVYWMGHQPFADGYAFEKACIGMSSARHELQTLERGVWLNDVLEYFGDALKDAEDDAPHFGEILKDLPRMASTMDPTAALCEALDDHGLEIESETLGHFGMVYSPRFLNAHQAVRRLNELLEAEEAKGRDILAAE